MDVLAAQPTQGWERVYSDWHAIDPWQDGPHMAHRVASDLRCDTEAATDADASIVMSTHADRAHRTFRGSSATRSVRRTDTIV